MILAADSILGIDADGYWKMMKFSGTVRVRLSIVAVTAASRRPHSPVLSGDSHLNGCIAAHGRANILIEKYFIRRTNFEAANRKFASILKLYHHTYIRHLIQVDDCEPKSRFSFPLEPCSSRTPTSSAGDEGIGLCSVPAVGPAACDHCTWIGLSFDNF